MNSDLAAILGALRDNPENRACISEHWSQGRSVYGGIGAALAVTAMRKEVAAERSLRSLMISFVGPLLPGESQVRTQTPRQGGNVTQAAAEVVQDGQICLQALAAFGKPRQGLSVAVDHGFKPGRPAPDVPLREQDPKRMPGFLRYFDGHWMEGGTPYSGDAKNQITIWAAHRTDLTAFPDEAIVAIADIPPPVLLNRFTDTRAPSSSLSWSLEFVTPPEQINGRWFQLRFDLEWAAHGYTQQSGKIFTEEGKLAALSRQTMVYFQPRERSGRQS